MKYAANDRTHARETYYETSWYPQCGNGVSIGYGLALRTGDAVAQQKSLKEQLVGTWKLVSSHNVRSDGSRVDNIGPNPKGILIYTSDGHFALVNTRSDLPKLASNSRDQGTPEEYKGVVQGSIGYFGTYSVNEADNVIAAQIEGSTFANMLGGPNQKRIITSLTADEAQCRCSARAIGAFLDYRIVRGET